MVPVKPEPERFDDFFPVPYAHQVFALQRESGNGVRSVRWYRDPGSFVYPNAELLGEIAPGISVVLYRSQADGTGCAGLIGSLRQGGTCHQDHGHEENACLFHVLVNDWFDETTAAVDILYSFAENISCRCAEILQSPTRILRADP